MLRENLIMLRRLNGFSQEQISEKIGISRQAYAKWETGATVPDIDKAAALAEVYGVTLDGLLKTERTEGIGDLPPAPKGKNIWGSVTIGERGALLANQDGIRHIPGIPADAIDTTAAGDTFNGAFAVALSEGKNVEDAIDFANRAAAISVTRRGAQDSVPYRTELTERT